MSVFPERLLSDVLAISFIIVNFDSKLLNHFDFPKHVFVIGPHRRNLIGYQTTRIIIFFVDMNILISQSSQESSTWKRGRTSSNQSYFGLSYSRIKRLKVRVANLFHFHLLEHLTGELLEFSNLDGSSLEPVRIACGSAKLADWTKSSAGKTQRVIRKDGFSSSVIVLILNLVNEGTNIDTDWACFLAWAVCTLHAPRSFSHCLLLSENTVVMVSGPIILELLLRSFKSNLVLLSIGFSVLGTDNLRFVELRSVMQNRLLDFRIEFCESKPDETFS